MANKDSVQIDIDKSAFDNIQKQFDSLKIGGPSSAYRALMKVAFKIKSEAQLRLTGRGHIITSRLKNSIFVKSKKMNDVIKKGNALTYTDTKGNSYKSDLSTVMLNEFEFAIGSNVEYAQDIELGARSHEGFKGDSFLYWAMKNVNVLQSVSKDMQDDIKFGRFMKKPTIYEVKGKALTNAD